MKRHTTSLLARLALCALALTLTLGSCWKDDAYIIGSNGDLLFAIGTVRVIEGQDYYFELDEGSKLYPGDTTAIRGYAVVDNQRAFVYFSPMDEAMPGYEYNASVQHIENILTKDIHRMKPAEADSIGDDRIDVDNIWLTKDYVNIVYRFYHSNNPDKKHMLNLVVNDSAPLPADAPLPLEFRHNAYGDTPLQGGTGIVSFRLDSVRGLLETGRDVRIRVHTLYNGVKYFGIPQP